MNKKTKLSLVTLILIVLIFSISATSANENITSDSAQVSNIEKLSVSNEIDQTTSIEVSASDSNQEIQQISKETNTINDYQSSSDNQTSKQTVKSSDNAVLGISEDESIVSVTNDEVLGEIISPRGTTFQDIQNAINQANDGDVIDLGGLIYTDLVPINVYKNITIKNGILDGSGVTQTQDSHYNSIHIENVTFTNYRINIQRALFFEYSTLKNVKFTNFDFYRNAVAAFYSVFYDSSFKNMTARYSSSRDDDYEGSVTVVSYWSSYYNCTFQDTRTNQHSAAICVAGQPGNIADIVDCKFINCTSGVGGAIYLHGTHTTPDHHSNVLNCEFINCTATEWGGAIGTSQDFLVIDNCDFINNTAEKGAAIMVGGITHGLDGDNSQGHNITFSNCYFYNNTGTHEGGAVHITGHNNTAIDCIFDDNFAETGCGAAVYVHGENASIISTKFTNHDAVNGTVYIEGNHFSIIGSDFSDNNATSGAAIYIHGDDTTIVGSKFTNHLSENGTVFISGNDASIIDSTFTGNNATHGGAGVFIKGSRSLVDNCTFTENNALQHGGAIHTLGDNAVIKDSTFEYNNAIPSNLSDPDYGLGGAIYIDGINNEVINSVFEHNTARNGSAIYTHGRGFILKDDIFYDNQAWSYLLYTVAQPPEDYWSEDLNYTIKATLIAGDNLINAIHNNGPVTEITFNNVTYWIEPNEYFPTGKRTTTEIEDHPVEGYEASQNGRYLYQDAHEHNQDIIFNITYKDELVFGPFTGKTDSTGSVEFIVSKENMTDNQLHPGEYIVNAYHPSDDQYTAIENSTKFVVLPHVDVSVTKTSDKDNYILYEPATFTIRVTGVGTNATNVTVKDILPSSFKYLSSSATKGSYNKDTNEWYIGFLPHLASETLTLTVNTTALGTYDNVVNVTSAEKDWNLSNNVGNKTIHVDIYYTKEANVTTISAGEYFEYYLRIFNTGDTIYNQTIQVRDILPEGVWYTGEYSYEGATLIRYVDYTDEQIWHITNIYPGERAKITIKVKALKDGIWNNTMKVWDLPPVNATVNVSSSADLRVIKEVSTVKTNKGDVIYWNISVKNDGPSIAMDAYVDDILPDGVVFYGFTNATKGNYDRDTGRWTIGDMAVGDKEYLIIYTRVTASNTNITNNATVNSSTPDPKPGNNFDNATTEVNPEGDVGIQKIVSNQSSNHGDEIYWTIIVTNHGPDRATGVVVTDVLPEGLQFLRQSSNKGSYSPGSGRWVVGNLENQEIATLTIYTRIVTRDTIINNFATVTSSSADTNPDNNEAENYTVVGPEADLELIKEVDNDSVIKGDTVTWTITVINHGPNDALNVLVKDLLPEGLVYLDSNSRYYDNNTGIWTIGHLSDGDSVSIKIRTLVNASNARIHNFAYVNSTTYDPNLINNGDDEDITVTTEADVGVIKLVSNQTAHYGDTVTWTIKVTNYGPNTAENVVLTDFIPEGLIVIGTPSRSQGHVYVDPTTGRGLWEIGNLNNGETVICEFDSRINTTNEVIRNVVNVTTTSHDPDLSNNIAYNVTVVPEECDVAVLKRVDNLTPNKYDTVTWTITVINHGPDVAKNVVVTDVLPAGLEYVSNTVPTAGSYQHNRNTWIFDSDLEVGVRHTLTITTRVIDTGKITNEVNVTSSTYDTNLENNYANETIDVPAIADLQVTKVVSNSTPEYGDLVDWTITVYNNGPNNARNVYVIDKLPQGLIYVNDSTSGEDYNPISGRWTIGDLLHFESVTLTITTRVNVTNATIRNIATVYSTTPDDNESNNQDNDTIDVPPLADLSIDKTVNDHGPRRGDNITWTITVVNNGPDVAVNAVAKDVLPEGLIFVNSTGNGTYDAATDLWTIGDLKNGEKAVLYIVTTVNATQKVITNIANVTSDTPDPDETNNEDNSTIDVGHEADLGIIKVVSNSNPNYGDEITWTITVTNNGPDDAVEVFVTDALPNGLVWITDNGNGTYDHTTGIWTIGTLHNHSHISLVITTLVNITNANITNIAVVDSDTHDPYPENNTDDDKITVKALADLYLVKRVQSTATFGEEIVWQIGVMNLGPNTAINAYVEDVLPDGLIYTDYGATKGSYDNNTGIWTIGNLTSGETEILYIWTIVNKSSGNITNVAVANSSTEDPNPENNKDNDTVFINPVADLEIIKLVSNKTSHFGDEITWTITVVNHGPADAENVTVTDKLPTGLIYKSDDSNGKYNNETGVWTIGNLTNGNSATLVITTLVNITNATIKNVAVVNSTTEDNNTSNNIANNTTDVPPEADLEIIKLVSNITSKIGDIITWTITVTNKGPDTAVNVYVEDELPSELILSSYTTTKGIFDSNLRVWFIPSLAKGESQKLTIKTIVNITNTTLRNSVNVTSDTYDPNKTNNEANNTTVVDPKADLVVVKVVSNANAKFNETITWTITVTNNGPDNAVNVVVNDTLPAGLIFVGSDGDYDNNTGKWIVGDLANGESRTLIITTIVNITNTTIRNVANATSDTPGNSTPGNNTTVVGPVADLEITKLVSNTTSKLGDTITWTITVTNKGPDTAVNAYVIDKLPNGLIYVDDDSNGAYNPNSGVWTIGDLAKGNTTTLVITTIVNITNTTIRNVANVTSDTPDNNESNNKDNNTTDVIPEADLEVIKNVSNSTPAKGDIIVWTLNITNNGPDNSTRVVVIDQLPVGLVFVDNNDNPIAGNQVRYEIPKINVGQSILISIRTLVTISNVNLTNEVLVGSLEVYDPNQTNNYDNETVEVRPVADLEITKVVSNATSKIGDVITWTITVTNNGPDNAVNVVVNDTLPAGLIYNSHQADKGLYDPVSGIWAVGDLANGNSTKLVISTIVNITNATIRNVANVTSDTPDNNESNNEANNTTVVSPKADLVVVKVVSNANAKFNETITWTITVTNNGPDTAVNTVVNDTLPAGLIFVGSDGDYDNNNGKWIVGDLAKGESKTLVITTIVNITNTTIRNVANATSDTPGNSTPGNNTTVVDPVADLEIIKLVSNITSKLGDTITWTIIVTNNGPDAAVNVVVKDELPSNVIFNNDYTVTKGIFDANALTWIIDELADGEVQTLTLKTIINATNTTVVNNVSVTSDTPDDNESNNEANNTTVVDPRADLVVVKVVSNANAKFNETITWTITVTNNGPDTAVNTVVNDTLPAGLIFVGSDGDYDNNTSKWIVGDLAKGESKTLVITTIVNITNTTIRNVANATSDTPGNSTPGNNTTVVGPVADLEIIKLVSNTTSRNGDIISWTIIVTNNGPDAAVNVVVNETLPAGLIYNGHKVDQGLYDPSKGVWIVGDLANGNSTKLVIKTIVSITNGNITNTANVTSDTPDNNESNNNANNTTEVNDVVDLEIIKTVSNANAHFGETITWTVTVINHGPSDAKDVVVTDKLPSGLIFSGADKAYDPETGVWIVGDLANGASAVLNIQTVVNITNKTITNVANVTSSTPDNNESNNKDNNTTVIPPEADLKVIKTVSNANPHKGDIITWTITVINNGPDTAVNVNVTDKLPTGLVFVNADGNYNKDTGLWIVGNLTNGESKSLIITTLVNITNATVRNVANATSDIYDPNETNNEGNNTTDVSPEADLEVIKLVSSTTVKNGETIEWTIIVTNNGPDAAKNVYVKDDLPEGLVYNNQYTATAGLFDGNTLTWYIPELANGKSETLTIITLINSTNINITNPVNATSDTYDPNETNNEANNTTNIVNKSADLKVIKTVSNSTGKLGDIITWTITVTNNGPDDAENVCVTDKLPAGLIFKDADGNYDPATGIWNIGKLANGSSVVLNIQTIVNITNKTITNVANVTSTTPDPNETDNGGNNTTDIAPEADLEVIKTVSNANPHKGDIINWTITVINHGPDSALNVVITDQIPDGLSVILYGDKLKTRNITVEIPEIKAGGIEVFTFETLVEISNATITNIAVVNSTTYDPNETNNIGNNTTDVAPEADLSVIKLVSDKITYNGDVITWTIIVTNNGPDAAENVYVKDQLPNGLTYTAYTATKGLFDSNTLTWFINTLNNGESATLTINTTVTVENTTLTNNVNVTSDVYDPNETNNRGNNTTVVNEDIPADLQITKVVSNANPHKGDIITWTITVTNNGPGDAKDVTVTDKLPAGLTFISADGNYDASTGIWTIGDIANKASKTLVITTSVAITNVNITNVAVVNSSTDDPDETNNKDNETTDVAPEADLKVIKTVSNPAPYNGETITWTIVVTNLGPDAAKDVVVKEYLPDGLTLLKSKGTKGTYNNGLWNIGTLNNGETVTLVLTTKVTVSEITIENVAGATSSTYDPNKYNNNDSEIINPIPAADLELIKQSNVKTVKVGDKVIWTITVVNHGPDTAMNVVVKDVLPSGLKLLDYEASEGVYNNGLWAIGDLEADESVTLTLITKALITGEIINTAVVDSSTFDPKGDNNEDSAIVTVYNAGNPDDNDTPVNHNTPGVSKTPTMHATGNPIIMIALALLTVCGAGLRRKN